MNTESVVGAVKHWIDALVVGLNLCPFAGTAVKQGDLRIVVSEQPGFEANLQMLSDEAHQLVEANPQATTLLVLTQGFDDFDHYLDLLATGDALLEDLGFEGIVQLASFHPQYQFEGTSVQDVSNWTNRAPYPILHLLQESSVSRAVEAHPDADGIPDRNIATLNQLGLCGVLQLLGKEEPFPRTD